MSFILYNDDCLNVLKRLEENSIDSIVTDPPYGLSDHKPDQVLACLTAWIAGEVYEPKGKGFMGKSWDAWVPGPEIWRECLRVLKPGGHLLAFAGTRSMDLMGMSVRLAGFELRDSIGYANDGGGAPLMSWVTGSGFPKSANISKMIDKAAGVERTEVVGTRHRNVKPYDDGNGWNTNATTDDHNYTAPATEAAKKWEGFGSALKPAWEPVILARKPMIGTLAANVLEHGTGGLNIDACRVGSDGGTAKGSKPQGDGNGIYGAGLHGSCEIQQLNAGRWPANLILEESEQVLAGFPVTTSGGGDRNGAQKGEFLRNVGDTGSPREFAASTGSAARFFKQVSHDTEDMETAKRFMYCAKASKRDRDEGLEGFEKKDGRPLGISNWDGQTNGSGQTMGPSAPRANVHPTVKPTDLMRYLCRLVTPPGGVVLDPFMGSGSTGKAAMLEGFRFIGIERDEQYMAIARARIEAANDNDLFSGAA